MAFRTLARAWRRAPCGCRSRACAGRPSRRSRRRRRRGQQRAPRPRTRPSAPGSSRACAEAVADVGRHRPHAIDGDVGIERAHHLADLETSDAGSRSVRTADVERRRARRASVSRSAAAPRAQIEDPHVLDDADDLRRRGCRRCHSAVIWSRLPTAGWPGQLCAASVSSMTICVRHAGRVRSNTRPASRRVPIARK